MFHVEHFYQLRRACLDAPLNLLKRRGKEKGGSSDYKVFHVEQSSAQDSATSRLKVAGKPLQSPQSIAPPPEESALLRGGCEAQLRSSAYSELLWHQRTHRAEEAHLVSFEPSAMSRTRRSTPEHPHHHGETILVTAVQFQPCGCGRLAARAV